MASFTFVPGAVTASTATALPSDAPRFYAVTSVTVATGASGGTASVTSPTQATIKTSSTSLGSGDFYLDAATQKWEYGSATTTGTAFTIHGFVYGEIGRVA